jgi:hypothetical protein
MICSNGCAILNTPLNISRKCWLTSAQRQRLRRRAAELL